MADISMCQNKQCDSRESCYRFTAESNEYRQSYSAYETHGDVMCVFFVSNEKGDTYEYSK